MPEQDAVRSVLVERRDTVLIVTLNRPEVRNAVNLDVHLGIGRALEEAEKDPDVRVVILTGAGTESFCAGADLKAFARGESIMPDNPVQLGWGFAGMVSHPICKPIIAAVNGTALGGGTELALASDIVIAVDSARFGFPEVGRGIIAGAGGAFRAPAQLPLKAAMEMLLTGDPIDAHRAMQLGLVNQVVEAGELMPAAMAMAARIARNAPLSVQASKRIARGIAAGRVAAEDTLWAMSRAETAAVRESEDAKEGPRAFAEKRQPVWRGR